MLTTLAFQWCTFTDINTQVGARQEGGGRPLVLFSGRPYHDDPPREREEEEKKWKKKTFHKLSTTECRVFFPYLIFECFSATFLLHLVLICSPLDFPALSFRTQNYANNKQSTTKRKHFIPCHDRDDKSHVNSTSSFITTVLLITSNLFPMQINRSRQKLR